eukprot:597585-Alexandrium_andersonii.AAC.1
MKGAASALTEERCCKPPNPASDEGNNRPPPITKSTRTMKKHAAPGPPRARGWAKARGAWRTSC